MRIYLAFCIQEEYTRNKPGGPCPKRAYNLVVSMPKLTGTRYKTIKLNAILHTIDCK